MTAKEKDMPRLCGRFPENEELTVTGAVSGVVSIDVNDVDTD